MGNRCKCCGQPLDNVEPDNISISGMYDAHVFDQYSGSTVDEVITQWRERNSKPIPAILGDRKVDDLGPAYLCPAIVSRGNLELRRVGKMVPADYHHRGPRSENDLEEYRQALLSDPDIPRLLAERDSTQ